MSVPPRSSVLRFSALQRAENSSIEGGVYTPTRAMRFSALQRAENSSMLRTLARRAFLLLRSFSALQRAENSSIPRFSPVARGSTRCFSALQRAENSSISTDSRLSTAIRSRFSALQRAENSSIGRVIDITACSARVSVLFSEPKIPQCARAGELSG